MPGSHCTPGNNYNKIICQGANAHLGYIVSLSHGANAHMVPSNGVIHALYNQEANAHLCIMNARALQGADAHLDSMNANTRLIVFTLTSIARSKQQIVLACVPLYRVHEF